MNEKLGWSGTLVGVQPRIRLTRSFDERSHSYLGYVLRVEGELDGVESQFVVAIGKAAQEKHQFRVGDAVRGNGVRVPDQRMETADLYKASGLKILERPEEESPESPPFGGVAPALEVYRQRGHRRLAARTYSDQCTTCMWGCEMPVEMIIDHWNPDVRRYRRQTFCYGAKSCRIYKSGPTRKVPGRKGMSYEEADWVDADATGHRDLDV